ncbi:MAG: YjcQ family protein, partial [Ruminococcus bromii]
MYIQNSEYTRNCYGFDVSQIDHNRQEISKERWNRYIEILSDSGYVKGVKTSKYLSGDVSVDCT